MKQSILIFLFIATLNSSFCFEKNSSKSILNKRISTFEYIQPSKMWGVDILLSNGGFGVGGFYALKLNPKLTVLTSLTFNESKDDNEVEYYDYWGQIYTPGKINRFLVIPIYTGAQYRIFSEDILDNFRPFINAAIGPTMIFTTNYDKEFFSSLGKGKSYWTFGGYVGFGAHFGTSTSALNGVNIRYYFIPYKSGLPSMKLSESETKSMKEFGGLFITLSFGKGI